MSRATLPGMPIQGQESIGRDRPSVAAELTQKLANAGINLRGFSASVIGTRFVAYTALDSLQDANQAIEILKKA